MHFSKSDIAGVWVVDVERKEDARGFFARTWCAEEFAAHGIVNALSQCSISQNVRKGTLRGMHYQAAPHQEEKLVSVSRGAIYDVVLDLRPGSPTLHRWRAVELSEKNRRMLFIPSGCAHGFQTMEDDTVVDYKISTPYVPEASCGVRWDDPAFGIAWPPGDPIISARDKGFVYQREQGKSGQS